MTVENGHCENADVIKDMKTAIFGNGRPGIKEVVAKQSVLIWIVIVLLIGNGGLLFKLINQISNITK